MLIVKLLEREFDLFKGALLLELPPAPPPSDPSAVGLPDIACICCAGFVEAEDVDLLCNDGKPTLNLRLVEFFEEGKRDVVVAIKSFKNPAEVWDPVVCVEWKDD